MIRKYLIAGLLVWLPIWVTYFILKFVVELLDRTLALLPEKYQPDQIFGVHIPGLGLVVTILIIFITGIFATNFIGHRVVGAWEKLVSRIPLIRSIHSAVKQVAHAVLQPTDTSFRKVLLIEYPRRGIWSVAFQTSDKFTRTPLEEDMLMVFIPTTPNPTSGFLTVIPKKDVKELGISVEEALRMVISLGVVIPDQLRENKTNIPDQK